jgi:hypothetical protein
MRNGRIREREIFFYRPPQPCGADQPGLGQQLPVGHPAVVKGQLAGPQVAADEQVVARRGGGEPGPGIPALTLGAVARRADLPAPLVLQQPADSLRAGQLGARGQGEHEVRRHPQHVGLAAGLEELPQLGAAAVDLVAAGEVEAQAVGVRGRADIDGQLPLGAELKLQRQPHEQGLHRVGDVLAGDPLPGADQRMPDSFPHVGQVHGVDPVGHLPRAPQVLALDSRRSFPGLFLPGLVDRADHHPAPPPRRLPQALGREPAHHAHRGGGIPARVIQQPLGPVRRPVSVLPGDTPPVHPGQLADQCRYVLACLQPRLGPGKARPQQTQQLILFPQRQSGTYSDGSGRLCSCTLHTGMITRRLRSHRPIL